MKKDQDTQPELGRTAWFNPLAAGLSPLGRIWRVILWAFLLYVISAPFVMWYEYNRAFPPFFNPVPSQSTAPESQRATPAGEVFTNTMITLSQGMLRAWLPNDVFYPSIFLDNPQNFQMGQLEIIRYSTRVLRDKLSRQRTTDKIDPQADRAFTDFSNNPHLWIFPAAEAKFNDGIQALRAYRQGLGIGKSHFYPRADNLIELLEQYTSLLGGVDTRLSNAPRDVGQRLSEETAGDSTQQGEKMLKVAVPWNQIDDNFYFARGVAYAMFEMMLAVRWEFRDVLQIKRSSELMDSIVDDLRLADFEPLVVLNGSRDSIFANHSLKLMATLENVRQKMINLQQMLER
ncbi:MAG: DUF2333 family protein [Proteobacteria bacterium]|nr:DUF2333 family protein [Pseudomonadota bacterium]MBU1452526.1 DUF2333 family protein [Pseudomonadota bacterium]MBU2469318.1 DUF2333 family protein [Pseudomonadota bacterium]MBU2518630.1 DUF2333 family protein [Pseudomonadota bacterium]